MKNTAFQRAIKLYRRSQQPMADALGVSQSVVSKWMRRGELPAEYVLKVEMLTKGRITKHDLRPDIYPIEGKVAPQVGLEPTTK